MLSETPPHTHTCDLPTSMQVLGGEGKCRDGTWHQRGLGKGLLIGIYPTVMGATEKGIGPMNDLVGFGPALSRGWDWMIS